MKYLHAVWVRLVMTATIAGTLMSSSAGPLSLSAAVPAARCDEKEEDDIEDRMEKVHKGRRSPYQQLRQSLALDRPDWNVIVRQAPQMEAMARMLRQSKNDTIRDSSDGYSEAAKDIIRYAEARDLLKARKAFASLSNSCGDCHFKGGVGGRLDN